MVKIIDLKELLDKRAQRIMLLATQTTKKIVKRELNKLKKDIIRQIKGF